MGLSIRVSRAVAAVAVLCVAACGGGGGGGDSPPKQELQLIMSGVVATPENASPGGASVRVTVGGDTFETQADAQGKYTIELSVAPELQNALVSILTKLGQSERSYVEMLSQVGSFGALQDEAGADGELTADENLRVNVSNLSTAEAVLLDESKRRAKAFVFGNGVDPDEALRLAAALELAADDPESFALPQGTSSTLDLARDTGKREQFITDIETSAPEALEQAKRRLVTNPAIVGSLSAAEVPADLLAALLDVAGEYPFGFSYLIRGFEFYESGSGIVFGATNNVGTSWSLSGTQIAVQLDAPVVYAGFPFVDCFGNGELAQRETITKVQAFDLVLLSPTAVSISSRENVSTPGCPAVPDRTQTSTSAYARLVAANMQAFSAADIANRSFAIPVLNLNEADTGIYSKLPADVLSFVADGSGSERFNGRDFTWSVNGGTLEIDHGGGYKGRYRPVRALDGVMRAVLIDYDTPEGRYADIDLMMLRDPDFAFTAAEIPARYFQYGVGVENGGDARLQGFRLRFDPDGAGRQEDDFIDGSGAVVEDQNPFYSLRWALAGDELVVRRYASAEDGSGDCDPQTQGCLLFDERILLPLNRVGERYYWLERRRLDFGGVDDSDPQTFLSRFYDRVPLASASALRVGKRIGMQAPSRPTAGERALR